MTANSKIVLSKKMLEAALGLPANTRIVGMYVTDDPDFLILKLYDPRFDLVALNLGIDDLDTHELPVVSAREVLP